MRYQAILFDMDGTLVPMDQDLFVKVYMKELCGALCPLGVEPQLLVQTVWDGVRAMVKNDGSRTGEEVFWQVFAHKTQQPAERFQPTCNEFYRTRFHNARPATGPNPLAREAVALAHRLAPHVALATNPLFPIDGQITRMSWVGLSPADFDLVTSYESDRFCKPNPAYYAEVCRRLGVEPAACLMIGNDDEEDGWAASSLGMDVYLVTDCRIPSKARPWQGRMGSFTELMDWLKGLEP